MIKRVGDGSPALSNKVNAIIVIWLFYEGCTNSLARAAAWARRSVCPSMSP